MKHAASPAKPGLNCDNRNVSDPRNAPTFGGLAGTRLRRSDTMSIPAPSAPRNPAGGAA